MLGLGLICWATVGSMILLRVIFRPPRPDALVPTMAIEVAPAAVTSVGYLFSTGGRIDLSAAILAGYRLPMNLHVLLGRGRLHPSPLDRLGRPGRQPLLQLPHTRRHCALIGAIAARTLIAVTRPQLLPGTAAVAHL
jgi:tellurite resistance protein